MNYYQIVHIIAICVIVFDRASYLIHSSELNYIKSIVAFDEGLCSTNLKATTSVDQGGYL